MKMNPELREALTVLTDFYIASDDDSYGVAETPGSTTPEVIKAWGFVIKSIVPDRQSSSDE